MTTPTRFHQNLLPFIAVLCTVLVFFALPTITHAAATANNVDGPFWGLHWPSSIFENVPPGGGGTDFCGVMQLLANFKGYMVILAGPFAVIMIIISGIRFILSTGDAGRRADAKKGILFAVIGLIIVLSAWVIINSVAYLGGYTGKIFTNQTNMCE